MNRPGTRFFICPLTQAQQRRRERSRDRWRVVDEIAYCRNIPVADAFKIEHYERKYGPPVIYSHATGEYP